MPGAIAPGTPMSDVTKAGDTFYTNEMVDNVLVSRDGFCDAGTKVYANGHDLKDPLLSPVYGDMTGFPPTILTSGTRDLLLSNTVRVHRKLRQAGVEADPAGLRGPVARALSARRHRAGDQGGLRRDRRLLRQAHEEFRPRSPLARLPLGRGRVVDSLDVLPRLRRVVEDDAERVATAGAHAAHAVAQVDAIDAARALHRPVVDREDRRRRPGRAARPRRATACAAAARSARTRRR